MTAGQDRARVGFDIPVLVAGAAAFCVSTMFSSMKPVLISRFIEEAGYSPGLAGLVAAMPFVGGALSSALMPWLFRRVTAGSALTISSAGLVLAELANAAWFAVPLLVLLGQMIAGLCGGVMMGVVSRLIAVSARPEQSFGIVDMAGVLAMSVMVAVVGSATGTAGLRGGFLAGAALSALYAAALLTVRARLPDVEAPESGARAAPLRIGWRAVAVVTMGVLFVTFSGLGFAFMVTAALNLGFRYENASADIGLILLFSAAGCLIGGWCAARFGPVRPLLGAFLLCAVGWHVALHAQSQWLFLSALGPAIFALQFCFPVLLALPGGMDEEGRLAAIAAPLIVSGFAWAAILAGLVVGRWGIGALSIVTAGGMLLCALLLVASVRDRPVPVH